MDAKANNYNSEATSDDGSCKFDPTNTDYITEDTWYFEDASSSEPMLTSGITMSLSGGHINVNDNMTYDGVFHAENDTLEGTWAFNSDETMLYFYEDNDTATFTVSLLNDTNMSLIMDVEVDSAQYVPVTLNWDHLQ